MKYVVSMRGLVTSYMMKSETVFAPNAALAKRFDSERDAEIALSRALSAGLPMDVKYEILSVDD